MIPIEITTRMSSIEIKPDIPSAQPQRSTKNRVSDALDKDNIINKITNTLHRHIDGIIKKEINDVLLHRRNATSKQGTQTSKNTYVLKNKELEQQLEEMQCRYKELELQVKSNKMEAQKTIECLSHEASKYQSALGRNLENFTAVKSAKDFGNKKRAQELLKKYKCTKFIDEGHYKSLLQAAMQRLILEATIKYIEGCFSNPNHFSYSQFETQIVRNTDTLLNVMGDFAKSRESSDDVTPTLPINLDNKFLLSPRKINSHDGPISNCPPVWFEYNDRVNPDLMEGAFDPDHYQDEVVQICTFPLICIDLKNEEKRKILSQANLLIR
ncbi:7178_t:CDS:2 [Gigaspora margarita]|uniref:7178_t:CDS:1 n=1 Tax=Gigaspora margarita TaxID=4874 RepID=A0ABM8W5G0_GIGMA|nr:7178_t:CDS:2 [Gigaspora margarita]